MNRSLTCAAWIWKYDRQRASAPFGNAEQNGPRPALDIKPAVTFGIFSQNPARLSIKTFPRIKNQRRQQLLPSAPVLLPHSGISPNRAGEFRIVQSFAQSFVCSNRPHVWTRRRNAPTRHSCTSQPERAIVVPADAGKTMLINLLMRFCDVGGCGMPVVGVDAQTKVNSNRGFLNVNHYGAKTP